MSRPSSPQLATAVLNSDPTWFAHFARPNQVWTEEVVNYWRPGKTGFSAIPVGQPVFLRLRHPANVIAGFGFYSETVELPLGITWELFGPRNGAPTQERFESLIRKYRASEEMYRPLISILLSNVSFLPLGWRIPWGEAEGWSRNIVALKAYDLSTEPGNRLLELMDLVGEMRPAFLEERFQMPDGDSRLRHETEVVLREGQAVFRARLLNSYRCCAVSGEHSLPVLDAAHITPYLGPASNHPQNGLVLRTDIHRLFDAGYVTVTPSLNFLVSPNLRKDFANGEAYYAMQGRRLHLPPDRAHQPSAEALEWHLESRFRR